MPSSELSDCKHQPVRVTAVLVTLKINLSVQGTSCTGIAPVTGSTGLQLLHMPLVRGERKEQPAAMSSNKGLLKKWHYDNKPHIIW